MTPHLRELFIYDSDVNEEVLGRLRAMPSVPERARQVAAHLLSAKQIWMMRLRGRDITEMDIWPALSWKECEELIEKNRRDYTSYLREASEGDLAQKATYRRSTGEKQQSVVRDILQHVLLHGAYHRGQLAQSMRREGAEPAVTDYIFYLRRRSSDQQPGLGEPEGQ